VSLLSIIYKVKATTTWLIRGIVVFFFYLALKNFIPDHLVSSTSVALIEPYSGAKSVGAALDHAAFTLAFAWANDDAGLLEAGIDVLEIGTEPTDAEDAAKLRLAMIENDIKAIFGCVSSACVRLLIPIAEELKIPFFYTRPHEGLISSRYAFFLGSLPNQNLVPSALWAMEEYGSRVHITGVNTLYDRVLGDIARDTVLKAGGRVTGEHYYGANHGPISTVPEAWNTDITDFVINLTEGDTLVSLMKLASMEVAGLERPPQFLVSLDSASIADVGRYSLEGHYFTSRYPQDFGDGLVEEFRQRWSKEMGPTSMLGVSETSALLAVRLWTAALKKTLFRAPVEVVAALHDVQVDTGETLGAIGFEKNQNYLEHRQFILKILDGDGFKAVSSERELIKPTQYPVSRSKQYWTSLVEQFNQDTSGTWVFEEDMVVGATGSGS